MTAIVIQAADRFANRVAVANARRRVSHLEAAADVAAARANLARAAITGTGEAEAFEALCAATAICARAAAAAMIRQDF